MLEMVKNISALAAAFGSLLMLIWHWVRSRHQVQPRAAVILIICSHCQKKTSTHSQKNT